MTARQIIVNGLLTSYLDVGNGDIVLLLHGWGDTKETFTDLSSELSDKYRVISLDLPGFGKTQLPSDEWGLKDYALHIECFLDKLDVRSLNAIIGHSNGGAIAITLLADSKLKVHKLVLLASAGIRDTAKSRKRALQFGSKLVKQPLRVLPQRTQQAIKKRAYARIGSDLYVADHLQNTFKRIVNEDVQPLAVQLTLPTLLVYGDKDTATPAAFGVILRDCIAGSDLRIIKNTGHFLHHDAGVEVTKYIKEFIT